MSASTPTRFSLLAVASALFGFLCVTGPLAMFLGWLALRAINTSDGKLRGAALAVFGLVTGGISIVLLVLGSLAVTAAALRDKSERAECENNLGKIGLAVNVYYNQTGRTFPPAVLQLPGQLPPEDHLSWLAGILPFLEERPDKTFTWQPLAARLDRDRPWNDPANLPVARTNVARFLCRSHPHYDPRGTPGLTHYVGIAGVGADAASLPASDPRAGFFGYQRIIGQAEITAGTSCTLLAVETTIDNGSWAAGGLPTVRTVDPEETSYIGPGRPFGGCHRNGSVDVLTAGYADASVRFITSSINPLVFRNAARISGDPDVR